MGNQFATHHKPEHHIFFVFAWLEWETEQDCFQLLTNATAFHLRMAKCPPGLALGKAHPEMKVAECKPLPDGYPQTRVTRPHLNMTGIPTYRLFDSAAN